jgi:branched-chain amino acid transport system permease protein
MYDQTIVNIAVAASSYILAGVSFYVTFSVARFYHFTHGAFIAIGAYLAYSFSTMSAMPLLAATVLSALTAGLLGLGVDQFIYRRIRVSSVGPFVPLLASLGIYVVIQNVLSLMFGDAALMLPHSRSSAIYQYFGARLTTPQAWQIAAAVFILLLVHALLRITSLGRRMRAIGSDYDLAIATGMPVNRITSYSFCLGYVIAAFAGVLAAANVDLTPTMGMRPMMMGMVAMIVGGMTLHGTAVGAVVVAGAQQIGVLWLPSQWQDSIAFAALLVALLLRPEGIMGARGNR